LFWCLWFVVGVQQQVPADWTATVLRLEQAQSGLVQRAMAMS
jgi:hypothetical protein